MTRRYLLPLLFFFLLVGSAGAESVSGKVLWIYDGDTLKVAGIGKVRLLGIDAPEHKNSDRDRYYRKWNIPPEKLRRIARDGLQFQIRQFKGKRVRLEFDHEKKDKYGRTLAYVHLPDGRMLNRLLLQKGYATVFRRFNFRLKKDFLKAERQAQKKRVGIWERD